MRSPKAKSKKINLVLSEKDKEILRFLARWRFCTVEQLQKTGFLGNTYDTYYKRLHAMRKAGLVKTIALRRRKLAYELTPRGAEMIDLPKTSLSSATYNPVNKVIYHLILLDFALAAKIEYLSREEALKRFSAASYAALKKISNSLDVYFEKDNVLHVLIIDTRLSFRYFYERVRAYTMLPPELRDNLVVVFLVFSELKKNEILKLMPADKIQIKIYKSTWKY